MREYGFRYGSHIFESSHVASAECGACLRTENQVLNSPWTGTPSHQWLEPVRGCVVFRTRTTREVNREFVDVISDWNATDEVLKGAYPLTCQNVFKCGKCHTCCRAGNLYLLKPCRVIHFDPEHKSV